MSILRNCFRISALISIYANICGAQIPAASVRYRATVIREARAQGGLKAPVAMFAGQLTQESRFNPNAHSSVGAQGLAQFMPQTSAWLTQVAPKDFPTANALDPEWSIRALVYYDYWLFARVPLFRDSDVPSSRWGASLASYNGGLGWTLKDQKLATCDRSLWWACVAGVTDGRTVSNITQYHNYPVLIMKRWMPLYVTAGWK